MGIICLALSFILFFAVAPALSGASAGTAEEIYASEYIPRGRLIEEGMLKKKDRPGRSSRGARRPFGGCG